MHWIAELFTDSSSIATCLFVLAVVVAIGLMLGHVRILGLRLGVTGVLFSGLLFGHFGLTLDPTALEFGREFGLILFVYAIGLAVGPGFLSTLRAHGLPLNLLAACVVLLGVLVTLVMHRVLGIDMPIAVGIFSGATTNTPSLAAAGQALRDHPPSIEVAVSSLAQAGMAIGDDPHNLIGETVKLPGLGYAIAYPFGVVGIILSMLILRWLLRANPVEEAKSLHEQLQSQRPRVEHWNLRVTNPNLNGMELRQLSGIVGSRIVVSRIWHDDHVTVPGEHTLIHTDDVLLAVGTPEHLERLRIVVGERSELDLMLVPGEITYRWAVVTHHELVGRTIDDLHFAERFGVQLTRVRRTEIEMPMMAGLRLGLGDRILVVGRREAVEAVAHQLGDLPKELERTDLVTLFMGIALGVLLGTWPIGLPGVSSEIRLGLAGGPLLVAILLSSIGRVGPWAFFLPPAASHVVREMGIAIFLAAVGLRGGDRFVDSLINGDGLWWVLAGVFITIVPLLIVGGIAYRLMKLNYATMVGTLAGSMTDPPALAFANAQTDSELPAIAFATVIPLTMILRVLAAQGLVLWGG
ncbi:MAG: transporter [Planctomycetaceae bacterium]|nr:MAG: transporter [Planctomycetaceae bacterium]